MANPAEVKKPVAQIQRHVVLRIAGEVFADPSTVWKVVRGQPVRGSVYFRIRDALAAAGYKVPDPGAA